MTQLFDFGFFLLCLSCWLFHSSTIADFPPSSFFNPNPYVRQAGAVGKYARSDGNTFIQSEEKQTLIEVALEIQKLLEYFEQTNPSATQLEIISYINDETTPSLKRRASAALKACGESVIDEFVLENKYHKVIKATLMGWLKPED